MNLLQVVASKVYTLLLLSVLVEENQIRVVVRDEIDFHPNIGVSVARLFDESPSLRQLVQASARAALNFSTPSLVQGNAFCLFFLGAIDGLQAHANELHKLIRLPACHIGTQYL